MDRLNGNLRHDCGGTSVVAMLTFVVEGSDVESEVWLTFKWVAR